MTRFGNEFTTANGTLRRVVYINHRAVGTVDYKEGLWYCFDSRDRANTMVDSLSDAQEWFEVDLISRSK